MALRIPIALVAAMAALFVVGASAYAFECYNASRSDQGNASAEKSKALVSPVEFLSEEVGLCPEGIDHVLNILEEEGFRTDFLINSKTLMASGLEKTGKEDKLNDGQGIDHLTQEFMDFADGLIGEGFAICEGGGGK